MSSRPSRSGRAGSSAAEMARSLAARERQRILLVGGSVLAVVFTLAWMVTRSAQAALGLAVMAAGIGILLYRGNSDAAKWRKGARGERSTARYLRALERRGYVVLHDRALDRPGDRANLDHLVIGPHGVVVVDSKNWHKNTLVKTRGRQVWVGRTPGAKVIAATALERRRVREGLTKDLGIEVATHAVLAIHGAKLPHWRRPEVEGIPLLRARQVRRWISGLPQLYDAATVAAMAQAAERRFPPYTPPDQGLIESDR